MENSCDLEERIGGLLFDEKSSDMTFVVQNISVPAHRAIVATSSEYFRALLQGNMKESLQKEVVLLGISLRGFKLLMVYVYTGQLKLKGLKEDEILDVLEIAHLYGVTRLEVLLCLHLYEIISIENFFTIYGRAHCLRIEGLDEACYGFMTDNPVAVLNSEAIFNLPPEALCDMLSQDTFCVEEIEIFTAVARWCAENRDHEQLANVLGVIRLPLIDTKELTTTVMDSGLIPADMLLDAIRMRESCFADLNFRGFLRSEVNLAGPDSGALRLTPKPCKDHVMARLCFDYECQRERVDPAKIKVHCKTGLTIALSAPFFISHIAFRFGERFGERLRCKYYVEASVNLVHWAQIIDHSHVRCESLQTLYFEPRVVQFIRLIVCSTKPTTDVIELSAFTVMHTARPFKLSCGFYVPEKNVACAARGARTLLLEQASDGLITKKHLSDSEWISHEVGKASIVIRLSQPFTVGSMRLLLKSDGSRSYRYYVETCVDGENWTLVADRRDVLSRSWQFMVFKERVVRFIRIVCTACTVGKEFSFGRFECPISSWSPAENTNQENGLRHPERESGLESSALKRQRLA